MAAEKTVTLKLTLKPATAAELAAAFAGVTQAAGDAGGKSGKSFVSSFKDALKGILTVRNIFKEILSGDVLKLAERAFSAGGSSDGKAATAPAGKAGSPVTSHSGVQQVFVTNWPTGGAAGQGSKSGSVADVFKSVGGGAEGGAEGAEGIATVAPEAAEAAGVATAGLEGLSAVLLPLAVAAGAAVAAIGVMSMAVKEITDLTLKYGPAASPVQAELLQNRMNDLNAVIGRVFVPNLELMTSGMQLVGDVMASILPTTDEMRAALAPLNDILADLREEAKELAPDVRALFQDVTAGIGAAAKAAAELYHWFHLLVMPQNKSENKDLTSAFGAAAAPAAYSSIEEYGRKNAQQAYSGASGAAQMPGDVAAIKGKIDLLYKAVTDLPQQLGEAIGKFIAHPVDTSAGIAGAEAGSLFPGVAAAINGIFAGGIN